MASTEVDAETGARIRRRPPDLDPGREGAVAWLESHPDVGMDIKTGLPENPGDRIRFYEWAYGPKLAREYRSNLVFTYTAQGMTIAQIMQRVNRGYSTVQRWLKEMREDLLDTWRNIDPAEIHARYMAVENLTDEVLLREVMGGQDRVEAINAITAKKRVMFQHLKHSGYYNVVNPFQGVEDDGEEEARLLRESLTDSFEGGRDRVDGEDEEDDEGLLGIDDALLGEGED